MFYQFFIEANDVDSKVSARGLMILFAIGVIPIIVGISVTDLYVSIPWLMNVSIEHSDRFTLIYAALLAYSVYRFRLSNLETSRYCKLASMKEFLNNKTYGYRFIRNFIFSGDGPLAVKYESKADTPLIRIISHFDREDPSEPYDEFSISVREPNVIFVELRSVKDKTYQDAGVSDGWGITYDPFVNYGDMATNASETTAIKSRTLRYRIAIYLFVFSFKAAAKNIKCLDYFIPIYCNIGLLVYLVGTYAII